MYRPRTWPGTYIGTPLTEYITGRQRYMGVFLDLSSAGEKPPFPLIPQHPQYNGTFGTCLH